MAYLKKLLIISIICSIAIISGCESTDETLSINELTKSIILDSATIITDTELSRTSKLAFSNTISFTVENPELSIDVDALYNGDIDFVDGAISLTDFQLDGGTIAKYTNFKIKDYTLSGTVTETHDLSNISGNSSKPKEINGTIVLTVDGSLEVSGAKNGTLEFTECECTITLNKGVATINVTGSITFNDEPVDIDFNSIYFNYVKLLNKVLK